MGRVSKYSAMGTALKKGSDKPEGEALKEVGAMLRDSRESFKLPIEQVAKDLHIAVQNLKALEKGDWAAIPGEVYARGYIRKYAEYLGYDPKDIFARLHPPPAPNDPIKTPVIHRHHHGIINLKPFIILFALLVIGGGLVALISKTPQEEKQSIVKPVPDRLSFYLGNPLPPPILQPSHCLAMVELASVWRCYLPARLQQQLPSYDRVLFSEARKGLLYGS